jgi:hypothetical protein
MNFQSILYQLKRHKISIGTVFLTTSIIYLDSQRTQRYKQQQKAN